MKHKKQPKKGKRSRFFGKNKNIRKDIKRKVSKKDTEGGLSGKNPTPLKNQGSGDSSGPKSSASHHDKFFKLAFSEPALAKELAKLILYKDELKVCDLKTLKVEEELSKTNKMDLILTVGLKNFPKEQIHILILVEHKSRYHKDFWLQFLAYQTILLLEARKPFVLIPAVFYHGKSRWKYKISFQQAFLGEFFEKIPDSFKKSMLNWKARFIDTNEIENEELRKLLQNPKSKAHWAVQALDKVWYLRHNFDILRKLSFGIFRVFKKNNELLTFKNYFKLAGVSDSDWEKVKKEARKKGLLKKGGLMAGFMDIEKEILQRGVQKGIQQGVQKGWQERNYEVVSNMLREKADTAFISKVTGMPVKEIKKLKNKRS